ncbi:MAG: DUF551 domain-containing protein [Marinobacter sp.]
MSNLDREDELDRALSGQNQQERLIDSAAAAICGQAYELMLSHTISGKWPDSSLDIKAEHDMLLEMAGELRDLKASDSEKPNSSNPVAKFVKAHCNHVGLERPRWEVAVVCGEGDIPRPGDNLYTHPASADKQAVSVQGWISVDDQLPDADLQVLVYSPVSDDLEFDYLDVCADTGDEWFAGDTGRYITHWMPLPEPPKEQGQ